MEKEHASRLIVVAAYAVLSLGWLVGGNWLLAALPGREGIDWHDLGKDFAFLLCSLALLSWLLRRYALTCRELSSAYGSFFASANDAFLVFDSKGVVVAANRKACDIYGYPQEKLVGLTGRELVQPDYYPLFEVFLRAASSELEGSIDSVDRRADGSSFPVEVRGAVISYRGSEHRLAIVRDMSRRVAMERAKAAAEARWRHALDFVDDAICLVALDDTLMEANQAFYRLTGLSPETAVGRDIAMIHPHGAASDCPVCQARRERRDVLVPMTVDHPCNSFGRPIEVMLRMVRDSQGDLQYALMGIRDLSRVEEMREQLLLLSLSAEVGKALTMGRKLPGMLQACAELLVSRLDAVFARIWIMPPGEEVLRLMASAGACTQLDGQHGRVEVDNRTRVGAIAFHKKPDFTNQMIGDPLVPDQEWAKREGMVAFAGQPLMIGDRVVGVMALFARQPFSALVVKALAAIADQVALGIDRTWSEEELRQKSRTLRILGECNAIMVRAQGEEEFLSQICDAIVEKGGYRLAWIGFTEDDPDRTVRVAASAGDTTGYLSGITVSWGDNAEGRGPTGTAIRTGEIAFCHDVAEDPFFVPWRDAARRAGLAKSMAIPLGKAGDPPIGALNIYSGEGGFFAGEEIDLLLELALEVTYGIRVLRDREMAKRAADENRLLERQVRQGQKMEAIGTLAGGIAHDFNNILAAILGFADLAKHKLPEDSHLHGDLDNVLQAGRRAKELVAQILAFSRQAEQERRPVEVRLIVKEAMKLLRASIPANIEFRLDIQADAGSVLADPTQIHQVVMNLCTNAYHAMRDNDAGVLSVSLRSVEIAEDGLSGGMAAPGRYILFAVSDTGCGMTREIMERIFEPYFTTKPRGEGTGLGLAVVHGIVRGCGGDIRVESEPGRGTTISVYLPREESAGAVMDRIIAQQLPHGGERVLVVDDEPTVLHLHTNMLGRLGYQVTPCGDSGAALAEFSRRPAEFDLIFTDMAMPGMPGDVLVERIRAIRADIPIIVCTGFSDRLPPEKMKQLRIGRVLLKPLLFGELADAVRGVLDS
ncbi:MAG: PAS domain S-box protein [Thermodesulfobacteriota bacterium]